MTIKIQCPRCAQRISATDDVLGCVVECPACQHQFEAVAMGAPSTPQNAAQNAPSPEPPVVPSPEQSPPPVSEDHARRGPAPHPRPSHAKPLVHRPPERRSGTLLTVVCAIAVVAGGLYWWQTQGPGFTDRAAAPTTKGEKAGEPKQPEPVGAGGPSVGTATGEEAYQGVWRGTVPRTVIAKPYDVALTITFNERGEGFPKFETPESDADAFKDARLATLFQSGGKTKVILLREWEVSLSEDKKTMTWSEVDGPAKVKFTKQ